MLDLCRVYNTKVLTTNEGLKKIVNQVHPTLNGGLLEISLTGININIF